MSRTIATIISIFKGQAGGAVVRVPDKRFAKNSSDGCRLVTRERSCVGKSSTVVPSAWMPVLPTAKPADYFTHLRLNLLDTLSRPYGRVLDVGCGAGAAGEELLRRGAREVIGVELDPAAAEVARTRGYQDVFVGSAEEVQPEGPFNTILCHDILEHLVRPDSVLRMAVEVAAADARLSVSIPNARYIGLLYDLVVRGTFGYEVEGHRDSTHLRWLTRKDLLALLAEAGWRVIQLRWPTDSRRYRPLAYMPWLAREFAAHAWWLQAVPHQ